MGKVYAGRYTTEGKDEVVVFIIGMRMNRFFKIHKWLPVLRSMPPMISELYRNRSLGFRSLDSMFGWRTIYMIQYWDSFEQLEAYSKQPTHASAWKAFMKSVGSSGDVGIFHETYVVPRDNYEVMYGNMPKVGLAKAFGHTEITKETTKARLRMKASNRS
ncbi:transcriptional regulator [Pontibacillus halophilus JSM 076056 = DSM 19796]|uniref:Transcriptional regulator n=1 Tax=Pontibacillus halophilus JSM 076056 = DSM 19796 TaxID=1385510 RepID=A0A0A5GH26_9BACI|nr:DUF4188 domain-containing protein [Pontibacillus halophilus]KGX92536.1 transcriptional regulator [Pontibacillus halophilus JSM 076056 = DSM 19796]